MCFLVYVVEKSCTLLFVELCIAFLCRVFVKFLLGFVNLHGFPGFPLGDMAPSPAGWCPLVTIGSPWFPVVSRGFP